MSVAAQKKAIDLIFLQLILEIRSRRFDYRSRQDVRRVGWKLADILAHPIK